MTVHNFVYDFCCELQSINFDMNIASARRVYVCVCVWVCSDETATRLSTLLHTAGGASLAVAAVVVVVTLAMHLEYSADQHI